MEKGGGQLEAMWCLLWSRTRIFPTSVSKGDIWGVTFGVTQGESWMGARGLHPETWGLGLSFYSQGAEGQVAQDVGGMIE